MCRLLCVLSVMCAGVLATGVSPALAAFPGENGRIAFVSQRDGGADIWTMNPGGSGLVNLTADSAADDSNPNWSADGRKIVFVSDRETPRNPTPPGFESPDYEVFVMNADGSRLQQITRNELDDEDPAWSPDGERIVFQRDFNPIRGEGDVDLLTMKADGRGERKLTNTRDVQEYAANWSPNGQTIAFASTRGGDSEIWTMKPNGSNQRQLTSNAGLEDEYPNWSPDGRRLVFNRYLGNDVFEVYTMRADGSDQTRLTVETGDLPAWSPDGRQIAFVSGRTNDAEVFTMRANGRDQVNRTNNPAHDYSPDWQPRRRHHGHHGHHDD